MNILVLLVVVVVEVLNYLLFLFFGGSFYRTTFEHVIIHSLALDTN
jgi:hypothetical protein